VQREYSAQQTATANQLNSSNQRIADNQSNQRAADQVAKDLEATRPDRCKKAREAYESSINSRRIYREKPNGEREYLNDAELAQLRNVMFGERRLRAAFSFVRPGNTRLPGIQP
ncbi:MAG: hypothetical protein K0Q92_3226, partial [Steroidobacteraceae bacterium]|nr:hypothetical protein [Steroidobacteraceae bacterium]